MVIASGSGASSTGKASSVTGWCRAHRDANAAKRLLGRLLKRQGLAPKRIITDKLGSYRAAKRDVMPAVDIDPT
jgi:transposase-like protein